MAGQRRTFRREGEAQRRDGLIAAALDCIADGGPGGATVRAIADRAGVTPGLIRHYFSTKEELLTAAYDRLMTRMTDDSARLLTGDLLTARQRLSRFVAAAVTPPVVDARSMSLWAGFIHMVLKDETMRGTHSQTYLGFRDRLQDLIAAALTEMDQHLSPQRLRQLAIAGNAVIDGLWLEGCALPEAFADGELAQIALASVSAITGLDLADAAQLGVVPKDQPA